MIFKAINKRYFLTLCLLGTLVSLVTCNPKKQAEPTSANYYEQCDTSNNKPNWLQKKLQAIQEQMPQKRLEQDLKSLLDNLQNNQIEQAKKYATLKGLGTLLYLDIAQINTYEIIKLELNNKTAIAHLKINHLDKNIRFKMAKNDSIWQFQGIFLQDIKRGTPHTTP